MPYGPMEEQRCALCGAASTLIASRLGVCLDCIRDRPAEALLVSAEAHARARRRFGLPPEPPQAEQGKRCLLCFRECRIPEQGRGYCGMRTMREDRLIHLAGTPARGLLHWYRDPLPTNCVADWVCGGHRRYTQHNLAIFYGSCTLDCLFCQNYHYRYTDPTRDRQGRIDALSARELAAAANARTYCVCFFGGDPSSQMPHALATGKYLAEQDIVICWETAGTTNPKLLNRALELSLESGGCIKFDLKAFDENLHRVLTGGSNSRTLENFTHAASRIAERPNPPPLVASTLLVPGYVDAEEVGRIAAYIADLNPTIPYALLAFHPHFEMSDLPRTSLRHGQAALDAAQDAGLENVRLGNVHLFSDAY